MGDNDYYDDDHASDRTHTHFCDAIGGRRGVRADECAFCDGDADTDTDDNTEDDK